MDVGEVEKQRWNGCPTGDGRVEGNLVEMDRDGVESSKLHVKKKVDMRVRKKYRQGQSADLTDPANTPTSVKLQAY